MKCYTGDILSSGTQSWESKKSLQFCIIFIYSYSKPFYYREEIFEDILNNPLKISKKVSPYCQDFLEKLLNKDPSKRLGANGVEEIMEHPFLESLDWDKLYNKNVRPPYIPKVKTEDSTKYIAENWLEEPLESMMDDDIFTQEDKRKSYVPNFSFYGEGSFCSMTECDSNRSSLSFLCLRLYEFLFSIQLCK